MVSNKLIASCGQELKIHEWTSGKTIYSFAPPNGENYFFKKISWSVSGNHLLTIPSGDKPIVLKAIAESNDEMQFNVDVLKGIQHADMGILSKSSEDLATFGSVNGEIYTVNIFINNIVKTYTTLPSPITFLDYTPKDTFLAAGCKNGQIFLYNTTGEVCSSFFIPWSHSLSSMLLHPTRESYLAAASKEGVVAIWDLQSNAVKFLATNHSKTITDMAISATEELLATVGLDRKVYIYDLRSKEVVFNKIFSSELTAVACSLVGEEFAIGTTRGRIFFIDKRQPDYTTGSISAQKGWIRDISFCNNLLDDKDSKLKQSLSDPILVDDESIATRPSNIESDLKTQASGDFLPPNVKSGMSRIPGGMDDGLEAGNTEKWVEQLPDNGDEKELPFLEIIEHTNLYAMKQSILNVNKDLVHSLMEEINAQFLKIRMAISREFCRMEQNNNRRWQEFNTTLLKLAGCEELKKEPDNILSETLTNDSHNSLELKPECLYTPTNNKVSNYTLQN